MASQKYNLLYGRLSQEDERQGESNSIHNQKIFLEKYAEDNGFDNTIFLADDGYSGTNFERPSWKKIIAMIERDEVSTLIVKDLSRLGREYLQVGQYTELYFPEKGVRFIAVNDGVDSLVESSNDFNPIRNWANELHAKDTSKKVRSVKRMQAERGERLGGKAPYGYKKKAADTKDIVPDEEAAAVVKRIFDLCASGKGPSQIARILTAEQVLTPANYYYRKTGASHVGLDTTRPYAWCGSSVTGILDNKVYLGHMPGLRTTSLSYKNKKLIRKPESEQLLVENTHEALITQGQWDIVQDVRMHKKRTPKHMDAPNMFSGLAFCADCGKPMVLYRASTIKESQYCFKCYTYGKRGKAECSPHHIREQDLMQVVLDDLRRITHFARLKERQFAAYINQKNTLELRREMNSLQQELDTMRRRSGELSALFKRLYEDNVLGRVTNEQFRMLSADYNAEQKTLEGSIPEKEARLEKLKASAANVDAFIEKAKRYTTIDELTPELVRLFIQRIEIGERSVKYSHSAMQSIKIVYRDIGAMDSPMQPGEQEPHIAPAIRSEEDIIRLLA
ncbi:DUF4368 domain-containing protein [Caproiciproducens galactitolivorans]|uniref:Recombinase n=1 Tax=Caproiciproducens galactitolivorans TaxID=642589 RepID=A0A4Z0Y2S4_9FIRM|nr:recombinase family protein [Caproiciproducens galactitolivorans]QEY34209.1 DUF4368 domain-containing protein [Caproiciproducens galactitolivorans]TGJ78034.1 recombinase [Caproiciproducens galactitolivorans]